MTLDRAAALRLAAARKTASELHAELDVATMRALSPARTPATATLALMDVLAGYAELLTWLSRVSDADLADGLRSRGGRLTRDFIAEHDALWPDDEERKTPEQWLATPEFAHLTILDPDGWNRDPAGWQAEWGRPLTRADFVQRLMESTIGPPRRQRGE